MQENSKIGGRTLAIIGPGTMGGALLEGILDKGVAPEDQVLAIYRREERVRCLVKKYPGITSSSSKDNEAISECDIVILCPKPNDLPQVFNDLRGKIKPEALVISIMAGVPIQAIMDGLGCRHVVRCMPNTPGSIGAGITGWTANGISDQYRDCVRQILQALGAEIFFQKEEYLDVVTGVSGTGTAYTFIFMEAQVAAAVREGLSHADARKLVIHTVEGAAKLAMTSSKHLAELRDEVTSPGGTTAAALDEMERGGFRTVISNAIRAACERSRELGRMLNEKLGKQKD